jgi:hypothetical protein
LDARDSFPLPKHRPECPRLDCRRPDRAPRTICRAVRTCPVPFVLAYPSGQSQDRRSIDRKISKTCAEVLNVEMAARAHRARRRKPAHLAGARRWEEGIDQARLGRRVLRLDSRNRHVAEGAGAAISVSVSSPARQARMTVDSVFIRGAKACHGDLSPVLCKALPDPNLANKSSCAQISLSLGLLTRGGRRRASVSSSLCARGLCGVGLGAGRHVGC